MAKKEFLFQKTMKFKRNIVIFQLNLWNTEASTQVIKCVWISKVVTDMLTERKNWLYYPIPFKHQINNAICFVRKFQECSWGIMGSPIKVRNLTSKFLKFSRKVHRKKKKITISLKTDKNEEKPTTFLKYTCSANIFFTMFYSECV